MSTRVFLRTGAAVWCSAFLFWGIPEVGAQLIRQANTTLNLQPTAPPATLSATGAFVDLATLTPNPGIVAYAPNVTFWSDYAQKQRWFSIPNLSDKMTFSAEGHWTFPTGMVWIKHFNLPNERTNPTGPSRRIETRFIVKTATGIFPLTYKWRDDQTDADLVDPDGADEFFDVTVNGQPTKQLYHYPARFECMQCHVELAGRSLGFTTPQMNGKHIYGSQNLNQIQALSDAGYFTASVPGVNNLPALAKANDTTQNLEWRVRSYFAANCIQCHQPGGQSNANWDARPTTPTDSAGMINGMLNYVGDDPANRFAVAGDLGHSMVIKRLTNDEPRMPPISTFELDPDAISLVTEWITQSLPTRLSFAQFQTQYFMSTTNPNAAATADPDGDGQNNLAEYFANTDPTRASSAFAPPQGFTGGGGTQVEFHFTQPANRAALVETSADLTNWTLWDVPGNAPTYPPNAQPRSITVPLNGDPHRAFRLRLSAP